MMHHYNPPLRNIRNFRPRLVVFVVLTATCVVSKTPPATAQISADAVRKSIELGVEFLGNKQGPRGAWGGMRAYEGGTASLCTLALLNAGVPPNDPVVQRALSYIRQVPPNKTYVVALQTMALCAAEPAKDRLLIRRNTNWLANAQIKNGGTAGSWSYGMDSKGSGDNSNAQYALLGLHEAARIGIEVDPSVWDLSLKYWLRIQQRDGGWGYRGGQSPTGSMTSAGIGSLIICLKNLSAGDAWLQQGRVLCCGFRDDGEPVKRGLRWLGQHFSVKRNPSLNQGAKGPLYYYLYGLERVGRLSGQRFIGRHDWYREGAEFIVSQQDRLTGAWRGNYDETIDTAFALLFLAKGRRPVLVSKIRRVPEDDWNRHRNDIANLTAYVEKRWRRDLTWQTVDIEAAGLEDLMQSPVLFISGRDGLVFTAGQKNMLREYVNQGGFLFVENCCNGKGFDEQFRSLMREMYPDHPLRLLPASHAIWYAEQRIEPRFMRPLLGIEACCRTGIVYCPQDLGCYWELARHQQTDYPPQVQAEVAACLGIGANVMAYATNRQLRDKLDAPEILEQEQGDTVVERGQLSVVKLDHGGGSDDAPSALKNLLRVTNRQIEQRVNLERQVLSPAAAKLPDYTIAFVHGRNAFRWSAAEHKGLARFVKNGGLIFGDAICASEEFAESFRREVSTALPSHKWEDIPSSDPIFSGAYRGYDLPEVTLRMPAARDENAPLEVREQTVAPQLEGIKIDGRWVVIFSPLDLSCALENHASLDCKGYIRQDAGRLGLNILLYAMQE